MSEEFGNGVPSLPAAVLYGTTALLLCALAWVFWRTRSRIACFIIFAVWARYMMSAFHSVTYHASPLGLSWNALGSCAIFGLGLLVIDLRLLRLRFFLPIYVMVGVILASGLLNTEFSGTANAIIKYGYFIVVAGGTCQALEHYGEKRFLQALLWAFAPLLVFQALSVVLGVSKATESDGSVSYIGGYNHEAAFSIALATAFVMIALTKQIDWRIKSALVAATLAGLLLANYRTAILAIVPTLVAHFAFGTTQMFHRNQRPAVAIAMSFLCFISILVASIFLQDRFNDLGLVVASGSDLIKPPTEFTRTDSALMSGRAQIWSEYIYAYLNGTELQILLGFGANSWEDAFSNYAHNTIVSQLYEYGAVGVIALLYLWGAMFFAALRIRRGPRGKVIAAHMSFILLSLATMPLWMIEGYIFYALVCGYTLFLLKPAPALAHNAEALLTAERSLARRASLGTFPAGAFARGSAR